MGGWYVLTTRAFFLAVGKRHLRMIYLGVLLMFLLILRCDIIDAGLDNSMTVAERCNLKTFAYPSVKTALNCLITLFEDVDVLQKKYGLVEKPITAQEQGQGTELAVEHSGGRGSFANAIRADLKKFHIRAASSQTSTTKIRRIEWAIRDCERFKALVNEVREINDSLCSVLDLGRQARISRQLLEEAMQVDIPEGLARICDALADTSFSGISAAAAVKQSGLSCSSQIDNLDTKYINNPLPMALDFELELQNLDKVPPNNVRCHRTYSRDKSSKPIPVILEWKEYDRGLAPRDETIMNINMYRLASCLHASARPKIFSTLDVLGYVRDPFPDLVNPRIGLLYKIPTGAGENVISTNLLDIIQSGSMSKGDAPPLGSRFKLARELSNSMFNLLASEWLHKGIRSHNIIFFGENIECPYLVGFDHSRPDHPKEVSVKAGASVEFDRYRHPNYFRNQLARYQKSFDVYALGVVLLEIGLWRTVENLHRRMDGYRPANGLKGFPEFLRTRCAGAIPPWAGTVYAEAVQACLTVPDDIDDHGLQSWFEEKVFAPLSTLNA